MDRTNKIIIIFLIILIILLVITGAYLLIGNENKYNERIQALENQIAILNSQKSDTVKVENNTDTHKTTNELDIENSQSNSVKVKGDFFTLEVPSSWVNSYKYDVITDEETITYEFKTANEKVILFEIMQNNEEITEYPGLVFLGQYNSKYYYVYTPTDDMSDSVEYTTLQKDLENVISSIVINK